MSRTLRRNVEKMSPLRHENQKLKKTHKFVCNWWNISWKFVWEVTVWSRINQALLSLPNIQHVLVSSSSLSIVIFRCFQLISRHLPRTCRCTKQQLVFNCLMIITWHDDRWNALRQIRTRKLNIYTIANTSNPSFTGLYSAGVFCITY